MAWSLQDKFLAALIMRGEAKVRDTFKQVVLSRKEGGYYFVTNTGALRYGHCASASVPCGKLFKRRLIQKLEAEGFRI